MFDVSRNNAYHQGGSYRGMSIFIQIPDPMLMDKVFTGKDSSRALAKSSLNPDDCRPEWSDLDDSEKKVLEDWFTFFSKRYNVVGKVLNATNL